MTTRISRHASKKASTSVNTNSRAWPYVNFIESDFDQPINYSLIYAEENSIIEEVGNFDYLGLGSEQENTLTTYYTEGTPFETPLYFSTSTSTSDLLKLDDTKFIYSSKQDFKVTNLVTDSIQDTLGEQLEIDQSDSYMELENKDKECESTDVEVYLPEDTDDSDFECNERFERIIHVTPSQSPDLYDKDRENKIVTFGGEDHCSQQTPLMFSRCSSLGSLSGFEQHSILDDHSSIVSEFSRITSEAVSPSELPESPAQLASIASQKDKKSIRKKTQQLKEKVQCSELGAQQELTIRSVFEDGLAVFKVESTPVTLQSVAASSLSSLTIDDDDIDECQVGTMKSEEASGNTQSSKEKLVNNTENDLDVQDEKILDEYIRKGIAKVTRQDINEVSLFNLQSTSENACKSNSSDYADESSDLTAEEEKLLDECIRRGIAKVTKQNINDVTSLSLRSSFSGNQTSMRRDISENQPKHKESQKQTAVCQTE